MKKLIFCTQEVNKSNIRRENRGGVEHIVVTSYTLPPDIVMNGVLYPQEITQRDFATFNRTPATIEHPQVDGNFVLASDPEADIDYRIGAFNENAELVSDGRLKLEKVVNVQKAMMTEKGKRLLDRIEEIEASSEPRPIHTSIGALVDVNVLDDPLSEFNGIKTNAEYHSIVTNMIGDHDAFLLDSTGAATPTQGTGIGINSESFKVEEHFLTNDIKPPIIDLRNNHDLSFSDISKALYDAIESQAGENEYPWIVEIYDDSFVYELKDSLYRVSYTVDDNGNVSVQDDKKEVVLKKEYVGKATQTVNKPEGDDMLSRAEVIALLSTNGVSVKDDISDKDLKAKFNEVITKKDDGELLQVNKDLTATVTQLTDTVNTLKANQQAQTEKAIADKVATIKNCAKYSALPESALTLMANNNADEFEAMYTDSIPSASIGSTQLNNTQVSDDFMVNTKVDDLPE